MRRVLRVRRPSAGTVLGGLALGVALSGAAIAAIPASDDTVTVCLKAGGVMRAIDAEAGATCPENHQTVTLATPGTTVQQARRADDADTLDGLDSTQFLGAGAKVGDADALDGLDSTVFARNVEIFADSTDRDSSSPKSVYVQCSPGKQAIGAGADLSGATRSGFGSNQTLDVALEDVALNGDSAYATAVETRATSGGWDMQLTVACADIR